MLRLSIDRICSSPKGTAKKYSWGMKSDQIKTWLILTNQIQKIYIEKIRNKNRNSTKWSVRLLWKSKSQITKRFQNIKRNQLAMCRFSIRNLLKGTAISDLFVKSDQIWLILTNQQEKILNELVWSLDVKKTKANQS